MIMVLLSSMHKCIYYIIKRERDNIAVFFVSTDNSLSYSFLDMSLISCYCIIPILYEVVKRENTYLIFCLHKGVIQRPYRGQQISLGT